MNINKHILTGILSLVMLSISASVCYADNPISISVNWNGPLPYDASNNPTVYEPGDSLTVSVSITVPINGSLVTDFPVSFYIETLNSDGTTKSWTLLGSPVIPATESCVSNIFVQTFTLPPNTYIGLNNLALKYNNTITLGGSTQIYTGWYTRPIRVSAFPTAPSVSICPANPVSSDDLTCTIRQSSTTGDPYNSCTDPKNCSCACSSPTDTSPACQSCVPPISYTYQWYRNGVLQDGSVGTTNRTLSNTTNLSNKISGPFVNGDVWECVVIPLSRAGSQIQQVWPVGYTWMEGQSGQLFIQTLQQQNVWVAQEATIPDAYSQDWTRMQGPVQTKIQTVTIGATCTPNSSNLPSGSNWLCTCGACVNGVQSKTCSNSLYGSTQYTYTTSCTAPQWNCMPAWSCNNWGACISNQQTRICTDQNNCGTTANEPVTKQYCSPNQHNTFNCHTTPTPYPCVPNWSKWGEWTDCIQSATDPTQGFQTQSRTDSNNCEDPNIQNRSQECVVKGGHENDETWTLDYNAGECESKCQPFTPAKISGAAHQIVNPDGNGSAVLAFPCTGYEFAGWSDGNSSASRQDENVNTNINVTASFKPKKHILTYIAGEGCTIVNGNTNQEVNECDDGSPVTADAQDGYKFTGWSNGVTTKITSEKYVVMSNLIMANCDPVDNNPPSTPPPTPPPTKTPCVETKVASGQATGGIDGTYTFQTSGPTQVFIAQDDNDGSSLDWGINATLWFTPSPGHPTIEMFDLPVSWAAHGTNVPHENAASTPNFPDATGTWTVKLTHTGYDCCDAWHISTVTPGTGDCTPPTYTGPAPTTPPGVADINNTGSLNASGSSAMEEPIPGKGLSDYKNMGSSAYSAYVSNSSPLLNGGVIPGITPKSN